MTDKGLRYTYDSLLRKQMCKRGLDIRSFGQACQLIGLLLNPNESKELFNKVDHDQNGYISFNEFKTAVRDGTLKVSKSKSLKVYLLPFLPLYFSIFPIFSFSKFLSLCSTSHISVSSSFSSSFIAC